VSGDDVELAVDLRDVRLRVLGISLAATKKFAALKKYVADLSVDNVMANEQRFRLRTRFENFRQPGELQPPAEVRSFRDLLAFTNELGKSQELGVCLFPQPVQVCFVNKRH